MTLIFYGSCDVEVEQNRERTFLNAYESRLYFRIVHFCTFPNFSSTIMSSSSECNCHKLYLELHASNERDRFP